MDKQEILRYLETSRAKSICVDRQLLKQYSGYVRDITIMKETVLRIEFNEYDYDEGGLGIKVYYNTFDELLYALEEYTGKCITDMDNISKSGWYPELEQEVNFDESGLRFKQDLIDKKIELPKGGIKYEIPIGYWKDLADGIIGI